MGTIDSLAMDLLIYLVVMALSITLYQIIRNYKTSPIKYKFIIFTQGIIVLFYLFLYTLAAVDSLHALDIPFVDHTNLALFNRPMFFVLACIIGLENWERRTRGGE